MFFFIKFLKKLFSKPKKKVKKKSIKQKKDFLPSKTKAKANRKYRKLLAEFKRKHKRKPSKNDLFKVSIDPNTPKNIIINNEPNNIS